MPAGVLKYPRRIVAAGLVLLAAAFSPALGALTRNDVLAKAKAGEDPKAIIAAAFPGGTLQQIAPKPIKVLIADQAPRVRDRYDQLSVARRVAGDVPGKGVHVRHHLRRARRRRRREMWRVVQIFCCLRGEWPNSHYFAAQSSLFCTIRENTRVRHRY